MAKLSLKSCESVSEGQQDLENIKASFCAQIEELHVQVGKVDVEIKKKSEELCVLCHYKDNEFPVGLVRIEQMKVRLDADYVSQEVDIGKVKQDMEEERKKCQEQIQGDRTLLEAKATKVRVHRAPGLLIGRSSLTGGEAASIITGQGNMVVFKMNQRGGDGRGSGIGGGRGNYLGTFGQELQLKFSTFVWTVLKLRSQH